MLRHASLFFFCLLANACHSDKEPVDQALRATPNSTAQSTEKTNFHPTSDELLNSALQLRIGMTEANVQQVLGKFEYSGILGSHGIHVPKFWDEGHPTMDLQIAFHNPPASLYPVVAWISDEVTLHIDGKHYRYSLTRLRHDMTRGAVTQPLTLN